MKKSIIPTLFGNFSQIKQHGLSYSLKCDPWSISKITFCANLRVSPIDKFFNENAFCYSSQQYFDLNEISWMDLLSIFLILQE